MRGALRAGSRRRLFTALAVAVGVGAIAAGPASALINGDHVGGVKGAPGSYVTFDVGRTATGHKVVGLFTIDLVPITCSNSSDTQSPPFRFKPQMRVRHQRFGATGDWKRIGLDPSGSVAGRFLTGGAARGTLTAHGELAGPGTHCHTGELKWHAAKQAPPVAH